MKNVILLTSILFLASCTKEEIKNSFIPMENAAMYSKGQEISQINNFGIQIYYEPSKSGLLWIDSKNNYKLIQYFESKESQYFNFYICQQDGKKIGKLWIERNISQSGNYGKFGYVIDVANANNFPYGERYKIEHILQGNESFKKNANGTYSLNSNYLYIDNQVLK